jgi:hypothetical protein
MEKDMDKKWRSWVFCSRWRKMNSRRRWEYLHMVTTRQLAYERWQKIVKLIEENDRTKGN